MEHESFPNPNAICPPAPELTDQVNAIYEADMRERIADIFSEIGATVVQGVSYSGEDPATIQIKSPSPSLCDGP